MPGLAWLCPALAELGLGEPAGARRFAPPAGTTTDSWKQRIGERRGRALAVGLNSPWGSVAERDERRPDCDRMRW